MNAGGENDIPSKSAGIDTPPINGTASRGL
jgi:hypothetical protein